MKVKNMTSPRGKKVANQFIITDEGRGALGNFDKRQVFQSYDSIIAVRVIWSDETKIELDRNKWGYSKTTGKTISKHFWEFSKKNKGKAIAILISILVMMVALVWHFGYKYIF